MTSHRFEEYIEFLRQNFDNLIEYKLQTGAVEPRLKKVRDDLFHEDPFVVFGASLQASEVFADESIYH